MTAKSKTVKSRKRLVESGARRELHSFPPRADKDPKGERLMHDLGIFAKKDKDSRQ